MSIRTRISEQANAMAFAQISYLIDGQAASLRGLVSIKDRLCAQHLNELQQHYAPDLAYRFVDQDSMEDARYYEEIIFQDKCIPTRSGSFHDYFNGLIWLQFGRTKSYLNALHWHDIVQEGHQIRTPMRDRVTHFDECGMVLVSDIVELKDRITAHDWQWLFVDKQHSWFAPVNGIVPLHFGHANLEMLCQPFIGLTAKVLVITNSELLQIAHLSQQAGNSTQDRLHIRQHVDQALVKELKNTEVFEQRGGLLALPILGIPNWHNQTQDAGFYANQRYFMPHPTQR